MVTRNSGQGYAPRAKPRKKSKKRLNPIAAISLGVGAVLLALITIVAFWLMRNPSSDGTPQTACFLLIDMTSSTTGQATSPDGYQTIADGVIDGCADRSSALVIAWFDQSARAIEYKDFTYDDPTDSTTSRTSTAFPLHPRAARTETRAEAQRAEGVLAAKEAVAEILASSDEANRGSDILAALAESAAELRRLATDVSVDSMFLVVLTDADQISDSYSFEVFTEDGSVQQYVDDAQSAGYRADLSGMVINFTGIETGLDTDGSPIPNWYLDQKEEFWTLYTSASGGEMCFYGYDSDFFPVDC